ncbi:LysR family transcriptional regulator [Variovorax sp.]|jgi:DNA-binding transcriptional LysR family regulator|uniref:LysR family transcriptional regulator n=1 Tax=Variovorax sp. TaxID=1871043 RepID=UPI00121C6FA5|nr:LysR family transcriptional regulator [Variovorax sp.]TAJ60307.1 MAG: LysR family transcriptional regulator [Variovorax sp.]
MDWSDVKIFLAVARAGSLGGAARLTGQSQPTMGRRLRVLEREVGQALFQRGKDGFVLTDEGAAVLAHSERMEEEALAFERRLAGQAQQLEGQLRVSSSDWFGVHILTPVFAEFVQQHPLVNIELITDARLFSLARREADLVFRIQPFDEADVVQRKAVHVAYRVYRAKGTAHPVRSDGQGVPLITLDSAYQDFPDAAWLRKKLPKARVAFGSNSREAQARMCAAGVGLAVLPAPLGDACAALEVVDLGGLPPGRDVWVGFHRDLRRLGRLRALVDATVERLSAS